MNGQEERALRARRDREDFAIRLMTAMIDAKVNGPELARRLHRNPRTVSGWVNADHLPDLALMLEIGEALGVDGAWLRLGDRSAVA